MSEFLLSNASLIKLAVAYAAVWGVTCGICERVLLTPRRRWSAMGPAYAPSMLMAFIGAYASLLGPDGVRFLLALVITPLFFVIGALPALVTFHLARWVLAPEGLRKRL